MLRSASLNRVRRPIGAYSTYGPSCLQQPNFSSASLFRQLCVLCSCGCPGMNSNCACCCRLRCKQLPARFPRALRSQKPVKRQHKLKPRRSQMAPNKALQLSMMCHQTHHQAMARKGAARKVVVLLAAVLPKTCLADKEIAKGEQAQVTAVAAATARKWASQLVKQRHRVLPMLKLQAAVAPVIKMARLVAMGLKKSTKKQG